MVYDKEDLEHRPQLSFSHSELALIFQAAKDDGDVKQKTLEKLKRLWSSDRTKDAYSQGETIITAR